MKSFFLKIISYRWFFRNIFKTIYLNFKCLPFKQAILLPILLYKPRLLDISGRIIIESCNVRFGMICLGRNTVSFYPNTGITIENRGTIIFKGKARINSGGCLSVNCNAVLSFGANFSSTAELKIACYHSILIGENVLVGWETKIFDTDFHKITLLNGDEVKSYGQIIIGNNVWIAHDCLIMKNTVVPDCCVVGARSMLMSKYDTTYSLVAGSPAKIVRRGCWLDRTNMQITYEYN